MKIHKKDGWHVYSEKKDPKTGERRHMGGPYKTEAMANERLRQIEAAKAAKKGKK